MGSSAAHFPSALGFIPIAFSGVILELGEAAGDALDIADGEADGETVGAVEGSVFAAGDSDPQLVSAKADSIRVEKTIPLRRRR